MKYLTHYNIQYIDYQSEYSANILAPQNWGVDQFYCDLPSQHPCSFGTQKQEAFTQRTLDDGASTAWFSQSRCLI